VVGFVTTITIPERQHPVCRNSGVQVWTSRACNVVWSVEDKYLVHEQAHTARTEFSLHSKTSATGTVSPPLQIVDDYRHFYDVP